MTKYAPVGIKNRTRKKRKQLRLPPEDPSRHDVEAGLGNGCREKVSTHMRLGDLHKPCRLQLLVSLNDDDDDCARHLPPAIMDGKLQGNQPRISSFEARQEPQQEAAQADETRSIDESYVQSTAPSSFRRFNYVAPSLPDIPTSSGFEDLELAITSVSGVAPTEQEEKVHKRASSVLKLAEENEKLKAELKAMTDRIEAAEREKQRHEMRAARSARAEQREQEQHIMEPPSS
ncbi:hypothetical protein H1R20_g5918, partial [Candolleomyces eurysporus]